MLASGETNCTYIFSLCLLVDYDATVVFAAQIGLFYYIFRSVFAFLLIKIIVFAFSIMIIIIQRP